VRVNVSSIFDINHSTHNKWRRRFIVAVTGVALFLVVLSVCCVAKIEVLRKNDANLFRALRVDSRIPSLVEKHRVMDSVGEVSFILQAADNYRLEKASLRNNATLPQNDRAHWSYLSHPFMEIVQGDGRITDYREILSRKNHATQSRTYGLLTHLLLLRQGIGAVRPSEVQVKINECFHGGGMPNIGGLYGYSRDRRSIANDKRVLDGNFYSDPRTLGNFKLFRCCLALLYRGVGSFSGSAEAEPNEYQSNSADDCISDRDPIQFVGRSKLLCTAVFFFGVLFLIVGSRFLTYGEGLSNPHHEAMYWTGYIVSVVGGMMSFAVVMSLAAHMAHL
jgi:hypothetical protein